ncbi:alpha-keto acid decarboxylase family protein [Dactylosporangium sp. CA-092794]|uniref:alpha-keto acid decarboxylase family protein n=1 Tax=Dactylosporangium sp. CA-092794 TaxID=3239929 RepID=UPI003D943CFA
MAECTVGEYLLRRLREIGVGHVFGVPGDYELEFLDQIEAADGIEWVGNCNELNAAYAADGYARLNGIAALVTTFSVGELSALNGIAGAFAESVPVVSIVGTPATFVMQAHQQVHHTAGDGNFARAARCAGEYTAGQALLDRDNAALEIDRLLALCWLFKRPVYLMLPSDVAYQQIEAPSSPLPLPEPTSDPAMLARFTDRAAAMLRGAESVAVLVGHEVDRYRMAPQVIKLAEAIGCPVAALSISKGVFPEDHDQYVGLYAGGLGDPEVQRTVEQAGCVIAVGAQFADTISGGTTGHIEPSRIIAVHPMSSTTATTAHPHVAMADALSALAGMDARNPAGIAPRRHPTAAGHPSGSGPLIQQRFWARMASFFEPGDVVIADQGTSYAGCCGVPLPRDCTFIGQPLWGSIGYTLPSLLGTMLAAPGRRHVLLIGDGSLQQTAQELSTLLRRDLNPIIILTNNDGYTVERYILGADAAYNTIAPWRYDRLVEAFDPTGTAVTLRATTEQDLMTALDTAAATRDRLVFIEAVMDRMDGPDSLLRLGKAMAGADYQDATAA